MRGRCGTTTASINTFLRGGGRACEGHVSAEQETGQPMTTHLTPPLHHTTPHHTPAACHYRFHPKQMGPVNRVRGGV